MAVTAIAMFITLGMAIDIGRMFIAKSETQVFVDAASLAAALKLDGTSSGIAAAKTAVATQTNPWNFGTSAVPSPVVTFAATTAGRWSNSPASAASILYVTVNATVSVPLYFFPAVVPAYTQNVNSVAVAGQISLTSIPQGLAPYTAVSTDNTAPNFGLTIGNLYDLQWPQFNSTRAGCNAANPDKCFVRPACADESAASKVAVVNFWASSNNGYWGSSSNSLIRDEVLDLIQLQPIAVGANIDP